MRYRLAPGRLGRSPARCFNAAMIDTPRLTLRPYALDDFEAIYQLRSNPEVMRFIGGKGLSREETWHRLLRGAGHWSLLGYGLFCVFETSSGRFIGETGLMRAHRDLGERFDPFPEAAWVFETAFHGKGYASEAVRAAHDWFSRQRPGTKTVCIIAPENVASLRVADKLGYNTIGTANYQDRPVTMLERAAS